MTNFGNLPFEKLIAYQEARRLLDAVRESGISESRLRDQALRAATSVCLNMSQERAAQGPLTRPGCTPSPEGKIARSLRLSTSRSLEDCVGRRPLAAALPMRAQCML